MPVAASTAMTTKLTPKNSRVDLRTLASRRLTTTMSVASYLVLLSPTIPEASTLATVNETRRPPRTVTSTRSPALSRQEAVATGLVVGLTVRIVVQPVMAIDDVTNAERSRAIPAIRRTLVDSEAKRFMVSLPFDPNTMLADRKES